MRRFQLDKNQRMLIGIGIVAVAAVAFFASLPKDQPAGFEFSELSWIDGPPLSLYSLKGNAVAVYFVSPGCIACEKFSRNMQQLQDRYGKQGLIVIGIQRPRYDFEKNQSLLRQEIKRLRISHPMAVDTSGLTASSFSARRPSVHIFSKNGSLLLGYAGFDERIIEQSIAYALLTSEQPALKILEREDVVYAGYVFSSRPLGNKEGAIPDQTVSYAAPNALSPGLLTLDGNWENGPQSLKAKSVGRIGMAFAGKNVRIVAKTPTPARVLYNGVPIPEEKAGADVKRSQFIGTSLRVYEIAKLPLSAHSVYLEVPPGFEIYEWGVS